jgi:hypothetical protein
MKSRGCPLENTYLFNGKLSYHKNHCFTTNSNAIVTGMTHYKFLPAMRMRKIKNKQIRFFQSFATVHWNFWLHYVWLCNLYCYLQRKLKSLQKFSLRKTFLMLSRSINIFVMLLSVITYVYFPLTQSIHYYWNGIFTTIWKMNKK